MESVKTTILEKHLSAQPMTLAGLKLGRDPGQAGTVGQEVAS